MVVHGRSADVNGRRECARNSEINRLAQSLNAAKPKLIMKEGRHVSSGVVYGKVIMTGFHPFLFPMKK
jgi:hypothetical protein